MNEAPYYAFVSIFLLLPTHNPKYLPQHSILETCSLSSELNTEIL